MTAIPDPDLYGPPTLSQCIRERCQEVVAFVNEQYVKRAEPIQALLQRYPDNRRLIEQLADLDWERRRAIESATKPMLELVMLEARPAFLVGPDGSIDERVPMMAPPPLNLPGT